MPLSPHALERVLAAIVQPDAGAGDEIPDGSRDENFARLREGCNSRPDMDRNAADLVLHEFALPCMKPRADLEAELANAVPNRIRAPNSPCLPDECREQSVAGRLHFPSAEGPQLRPDVSSVLLSEPPPRANSELGRAGGAS